MNSCSLKLALTASLVAHGGLLAFLHPASRQNRPRSTAIEVDVLEAPARRAPPEALAPLANAARAPRARKGGPTTRNRAPAPIPRLAETEATPGLSPNATVEAGDVVVAVGGGPGDASDGEGDGPGSSTFASAVTAVAPASHEMPVVEHEFRIPYPRGALLAGVEGTVVMSVQIDETGRVSSAIVLDGVGHGLDEAALEAIRHYRFKPAKENGRAHAIEITYRYCFALR